MTQVAAPGWTADWLNAWLAAIGATVLVDGLRLHWSDEVKPHAVFTTDRDDPLAEVLAAAMPSREELDRYALATRLEGCSHDLKRNVTTAVYQERAAYAREHCDASLGMVLSDLGDDARGAVQASAFYKGGTGGSPTIHSRLLDVLSYVDSSTIDRSLMGVLPRVQKFGLGFDTRRFIDPSYAVETRGWVDPVIEAFAFFGLLLFPVRGNGKRVRTRGWRVREREEVFEWRTWHVPLTSIGIDTLLDMPNPLSAGRRYRSVAHSTGGEYGFFGYASLPI